MPLRYAVDVWNAGANPFGVIQGNKADVDKLKSYYGAPENSERLNSMPLDSQLFMRYLSGKGAEGMTIDQDRGLAIYQSIKDQESNLTGENRERILGSLKSSYGDGHYQRVMKGDIPVYYGGSSEGINVPATIPSDKKYRGELKNSLGSFWATPNSDGSFDIEDRYNFNYAPSTEEGWDSELGDVRKKILKERLSTSLNPADIGRRIVMDGGGKPFSYRMRVNRDGTVLMNPEPFK